MSDKSSIEWCDATWNPTVGCTKVSLGCDHCYAEGTVNRWHAAGSLAFPNRFDVVHVRNEVQMRKPLTWTKPRRIFVNSLSDLFHDDVPDDTIARVFAIMRCASWHTFQLLTKRHGRMRSLLNSRTFVDAVDLRTNITLAPHRGMPIPDMSWPLRNLWLGVTAEDQQWADLRIPALLDTPAAVRWVSAEPLLGRLNLRRYIGEPSGLDGDWTTLVDWVVAGGESGPSARPMNGDWVRDLRTQCAIGGTAFLFKQWGGRTAKAGGRTLDGRTHDEYPRVPVAP